MEWLYILKCENNIYYVGQTKRLYRRFWEHQDNRGGVNTSIYTPEKIIAIYRVSNIAKFIDYNEYIKKINLGIWHGDYEIWKLLRFNDNDNDNDNSYDKYDIENNIVECMMLNNIDNWKNIRGGKYVRFDCNYNLPNNEYIKELPLCNCGLPCDIKKHKNKESLFFRCAKKNMWEKFKEDFEIEDEPCNYYREYLTDIKLREKFKELMKNSHWLNNVPNEEDGVLGECITCNKYVWSDREGNFKNNGINYNNSRKLLCYDCFINKNKELKNKYDIKKCLITF